MPDFFPTTGGAGADHQCLRIFAIIKTRIGFNPVLLRSLQYHYPLHYRKVPEQ